MTLQQTASDAISGRSPHGGRGLKYDRAVGAIVVGGRSPHGERGLKYHREEEPDIRLLVAPRMGSVD